MLDTQSAGERGQRGHLGLAIVGCLFVAGALLSWRKWPDAQIDYGLQLYLPWQIGNGSVLYSGVKYLTGGPLSQYFNAFLFRVFGASLLTLVLCNLALAALWLALLYRCFLAAADVWTASLICAGVVLVFAFQQDADVGNYNYVTPYCHEVWHGLLLSTLAIVFLSRWFERGRWWWAVAAGFCTGLVFLTKPEVFAALAAAMACAGVVYWLAPNRVFAQSRFTFHESRALGSAGAFLAALAPVLALFFCFLSVQSWRESLRSVCFAWVPLLSSSAARSPFYAWCMGLDAPVHHLAAMLLQFVVIAAALVVCAWVSRWKPDSSAKRLGMVAFGALLLALASGYDWSDCGRSLPLLSLITCILLARRALVLERVAWFPLLWSFFGLFLLGKLGLFSRIWHYGFALAMPSFAGAVYLLVWVVPSLVEKYSVNRKYFRAVIALALAAGFLQVFAQTQSVYRQKTFALGEGMDRFLAFPGACNPANPIIAASVEWMKTNTPSNATLAVLPEGAMVNYLSRRRNPTGYLVWNPVELKFFGESMIAAFENNSPDYVLLLPREVSEFGVRPFGQDKGFGLELMQWVRTHYEPVVRFDGATGAEALSGVMFKRTSAAE